MKQMLYNKHPVIRIDGWENDVWIGYAAIAEMLRRRVGSVSRAVLVVECYPGVRTSEIAEAMRRELTPARIVRAEDAAWTPEELLPRIERYLTDDRVFGFLAPHTIDELYDPAKLAKQREAIADSDGLTIVIGFGASLLADADLLVYADLSRWEIQLRYRSKEMGNWQADNASDDDILRKYKRGFFFEWRVADRLKRQLLERADYYLDTHVRDDPRMISGEALFDGLRQTSRRPFRLVPYFDPGVWGGHWLESHIDLPPKPNPYAWGFDGVPEENSLYFQYGNTRIELPSINLVFFRPVELLGERVYARFGAEFPIRFDFLDTVGGQNLSLQVHPSTDYIRRTFGMTYTQDESYYILDAKPGAQVYLGLKNGIDPEAMETDLTRAQNGEISFPADRYINAFSASKHDHFLIPAGTVHCSCTDCMVLEISATPYIFTFKLWDWERLGLDGKPRPVHLDHGFRNIRWDFDTDWTQENLVDRVEKVAEGEGWQEERTGLHEFEFIETRRHWFSEPVLHHTRGSVNMLNLVEGREAIVESPTGAFEPFIVRYAETFIVPAEVGEYIIRPHGAVEGERIATIKAYVRA